MPPTADVIQFILDIYPERAISVLSYLYGDMPAYLSQHTVLVVSSLLEQLLRSGRLESKSSAVVINASACWCFRLFPSYNAHGYRDAFDILRRESKLDERAWLRRTSTLQNALQFLVFHS